MSTLLGAGGPLLISRLATLPCRYTSTRLPALLAFNARRLHANSDGNHEQKKQLSLKDRLKVMTKEYGKVTIGVYLVYDVISFGCFYSALKMGVDIGALLTKIGLDVHNAQWAHSEGSTIVIAYAAHKVFAPVRILLTVGSMPSVVRVARQWGYLKDVKSGSIQEVRSELSDKKDEYMDHYKEKAEEWLDSFNKRPSPPPSPPPTTKRKDRD